MLARIFQASKKFILGSSRWIVLHVNLFMRLSENFYCRERVFPEDCSNFGDGRPYDTISRGVQELAKWLRAHNGLPKQNVRLEELVVCGRRFPEYHHVVADQCLGYWSLSWLRHSKSGLRPLPREGA